jgi:hypothetical protein
MMKLSCLTLDKQENCILTAMVIAGAMLGLGLVVGLASTKINDVYGVKIPLGWA